MAIAYGIDGRNFKGSQYNAWTNRYVRRRERVRESASFDRMYLGFQCIECKENRIVKIKSSR